MAFSYYYILSLLRAVIWMMRWHENKPMIYLLYKPCSSNIAERAVFLLHFWAIGFCRYFLVTENFVFLRALFSFLVFLSTAFAFWIVCSCLLIFFFFFQDNWLSKGSLAYCLCPASLVYWQTAGWLGGVSSSCLWSLASSLSPSLFLPSVFIADIKDQRKHYLNCCWFCKFAH